MVRSLWVRTLAATIVWTGVAWAQQPSSSAGDKKTEQILTIQEAGKAAQKCKVINAWRTSDGHQAYQVRALDTGEMMTITEKSTAVGAYGAKPTSVATEIYHWGASQTSPAKVPAPPVNSPIPTSAYGAKFPAQSNGPVASPYGPMPTDMAKPIAPSPYSSLSKPSSPAPAVAAKPITTPVPDKDWRQSWAKTDDKPLRIDDKPAFKDSIADVPPLRIEGKAPTKDFVFDGAPKEGIKANDKSIAKQQAVQPKGALSPDDPLLNPEKYMPKSLDLTPRTKVPEPAPVRVPTIADLAGARPEPKMLPAPDKSTSAFDAGKLAGAGPIPALPPSPQPTVVPIVPSVLDKPLGPTDKSKLAATSIIPVMPATAQPNTLPTTPAAASTPMVVFDVSKSAGTGVAAPAMQASGGPPVIPALPLASDMPFAPANPEKSLSNPFASSTPVIPTAPVGAAAMPPPNIPSPRVASTAPPAASASDVRGERPNFLIMDGAGAESSDHSIKLPGAPNAVVTFGQPVTVTAPPPDMVRKKSLEAHSIQVMVTQLKESLYPSQREWAAEGLTSANWKIHPQVVDALCGAAQDDPAPSVRCRCALSLATMNVRTETALEVIHKLQTDKDEAVRAQADEALKILEPGNVPH